MYKLIKRIEWKYFLQYALSVVLLGFLDLVLFGFTFERLATADFWTNMTINLIAMIIMFNTAANQRIEKLVDSDLWIKESEEVLQEFATEKGLDFDQYIADVNFERKKDAYLAHLQAKIQRLKQIPRFNIFRPLNRRKRRKDLEIWGISNEEVKAKNYYCIYRKELENQLITLTTGSRTEIENFLMSVDVDYDQLTESAIISNYNRINKREFESGKVKKFRDNVGMFTYIVIYSAFIAGIDKDGLGFAEIKDPAIIFNYLFKVFMLVRQYFNGQNYAPKFVTEHIKDQIQKRLTHVKAYWAWKDNKQKEVK